ncbi:hypothetical protein B0T19DRAFT_121096 [Cercophora scortea]|uniref:Alkyl hydroperoxide reductase subunit C/ Thiol specific antioxidant domain-containing protein n=1 Tax=Cercophora scortea TaxID=314031 RepID=A0AAE0MI15_9PEZI|nr:hypothetical protein B0T19DRAFT_121096 [Cercophora scortea]
MSVSLLANAIQEELQSFRTPPEKHVAPVPKVGDRAPESAQLSWPSGRPTIIVFLRHCGCPFAEKTFRALTALSTTHPEIHCIAITQASQAVTDKWIIDVGGEWDADVVADPARDLYAQWGLGLSSAWYAMGPGAVYSALRLGRDEGIWNRLTTAEGGNRWQVGGAFGVDPAGFVRWVCVGGGVGEVPAFEEGVEALGRPAGVGLAA